MKNALSRTKHFQISQVLGDRIKYLAPGDPLPTVVELMNEFNASQATITRAVDRLRKQGLVERPLGKKRLIVAHQMERTIYRIVFVRPSWPSPDFDRLLYAVQEAALRRHWGVDIFCYSSVESLNLNRALDNNDAALFVSGAEPLPDALKKALQSAGKPVVFLRESPSRISIPSIGLDDHEVGRLATTHLLELGHRNILALTSEPHCGFTSRRLSGWRDAMQKAKIKNFSHLLVDCSVQPGTNSIKGSYEKLVAWLHSSDRPTDFTGIFCVDWTGALAVMRAFREFGLSIPEDVSLITFSGEEDWSAYMNPPMTTIEINLSEFAQKSLELIESLLSRKSTAKQPPTTIQIKPFLVVRKSTTKLRKA